eukprot:10047778-Ditylum_brightwellii.AAC.1
MLNSIHSIVYALSNQGNYAQAEAMYQQCWEVSKTTLGNDHPNTLNVLNNMAVPMDGQGNHDKAVELLQGCWRARKEKL